MMRIHEKFKLQHERLNEQLKAINKLKGTKRKDIGESEPDDPMQPVQVKREQIEEDEPAVRDIRERHRYMDSDEFDRAAGKADQGERSEERDLIFLLPPDRVLHREVKGNTTAFIKGLPSDAGERIMLDVFSSFDGKLRSRRHFGITAIRFGYGKYRLNEPVFDGAGVRRDVLYFLREHPAVKRFRKPVQRLLLRREGRAQWACIAGYG